MTELSIIIPSRNEKYLQKTVEDILEHIEGDTEVLIGYDDGNPTQIANIIAKFAPNPHFGFHEFANKVIGQRAMMNRLAKEAKGKYIMKVDAHCSFSQGFDCKMMEAMDNKTIMSPYMMKLDAESWTILPQNPTSMYVFDTDLVMQYWKQGENEELINETMLPIGAAFMVDRQKYWDWNLCDESLGSWGGQCTELGIKAFLNGGKCVTNKNVYFGHMFREKKEDFPYDRGEHPGQFALEELRKRYKNKSIANLIEKFNFPANWSKELVDNLPNA